MRSKFAGLMFWVLLCGAAAAQAPNPDAPMPLPPPPATNPPMTGPKLLLSTTMGDLVIQLDAVRAPKTVANILSYVRERHYDGTVIYRVVKGFVLEMGSWDAEVKGRPIHRSGPPLEANNGLKNLRGTLSLARGDAPDSGRADFFINLSDNNSLDQSAMDTQNVTGFAVFGMVESGMDIADQMSVVPVGDKGPMPGEAPVTPIVITKMRVIGEPEPPPRKPAAKPVVAKPTTAQKPVPATAKKRN